MAAAFVNVASYLVFGILIFALVYRTLSLRRKTLVAAGITLVVLLCAPVSLLTLAHHNLYYGYIALVSYHNPTVNLLRPLALILFLFAASVFQGRRASMPLVLLCAAVAALSTIAKPSFTIALLPALGLVTLYALYRRWRIDWRLLVVGIGAPITVVIGWQLVYYQAQGIGGFAFAPFQVVNYFSPGTWPLKFFLSILFPALVYSLYFQKARKNLPLNLAWLAFLFGAFYTYFFVETRAWQDGNFGWSGEITALILFVTSVVFLVRQYARDISIRQQTRRFFICLAALVLHLVSGIAFYLLHLTDQWNQWY